MSSVKVTFSAPDRIVMKWGFKQNWSDINGAMKSAAQGSAKFNGKEKNWSIPIDKAVAVAKAVREHYEELADAIEDNKYVKNLLTQTIQRVELSSAVETDIELPENSFFPYLRKYQRVAPVMYMTGERKRILIADEMGLGKSLQALACAELAGHQRILIVCPSVVKHNWYNEIDKWVGDADICSFIINGWEGNIEQTRFNIINYDILDRRIDHLMANDYDCIIFDEVHRIKNPKSKTSIAAMRLGKDRDGIIALSGTPITNRPIEFYPTLSMMLPYMFSNYFSYAKAYCGAKRNAFGWDFSGSSNIETSSDGFITPLNHLLRDFMLRRSMDDPRIAGNMPSLIETIIPIELKDEELSRYKLSYNSWMEQWVDHHQQFGSESAGFSLSMMSDLRHMAGRLKVDTAVKWATTYFEQNGKPLVIFAHHNDVISNLLAKLNKERRRAYCIVGSTNPHARVKSIKEFQEGKIDFLICSTMAMKEGVNLDRANTTLFVEREWTPAWEQQAAARVRRMTQEESTCHKVILSAKDTIDTMFDQVVAEKTDLVERVLDGKSGLNRDSIGKALIQKLMER